MSSKGASVPSPDFAFSAPFGAADLPFARTVPVCVAIAVFFSGAAALSAAAFFLGFDAARDFADATGFLVAVAFFAAIFLRAVDGRAFAGGFALPVVLDFALDDAALPFVAVVAFFFVAAVTLDLAAGFFASVFFFGAAAFAVAFFATGFFVAVFFAAGFALAFTLFGLVAVLEAGLRFVFVVTGVAFLRAAVVVRFFAAAFFAAVAGFFAAVFAFAVGRALVVVAIKYSERSLTGRLRPEPMTSK